MDDSLKLFKDYFRDIYTANKGSCAGKCNEITPPALGPAAYEMRRCCKEACSEGSLESLDECRGIFCVRRCTSETLAGSSADSLSRCVEICQQGCEHRFANEPTPPSHK